MLRGYTLTALTCDTCSVTPLMRESAASAAREDRQPIQFCAQCDGRPDAGASSSTQPAVASELSTADDMYSRAPASSSQSTSRAPPATSQADKAAESISTLLLQGYSLLSSNCPNTACRGIPLVGYPRRKDGSKDGRRMCVSCGGAWVDEGDVGDMKTVEKRPAEHESAGAAESPRSKARRELYATGTSIVEERARAAQVAQSEETREMDLDEEEEDEDEGNAQAASLLTKTPVSPRHTRCDEADSVSPARHSRYRTQVTLSRRRWTAWRLRSSASRQEAQIKPTHLSISSSTRKR